MNTVTQLGVTAAAVKESKIITKKRYKMYNKNMQITINIQSNISI